MKRTGQRTGWLANTFMMMAMAWAALTGCSGQDLLSGERCSAERRCSAGQAEVCGEDGQQYACAALARCEGVIVDLSGAACEPPITCPPIAPPECLMGERLNCEVGFEGGCMMCECEPQEEQCPDVDYAPCPLDSVFVCHDDDQDGCDECFCEPVGCPPIAPPECLMGEELVCEVGFEGGCMMCECEPQQQCPDPDSVPVCLPGSRDCWCEPIACGPVEMPVCQAGERPERFFGRPPCSWIDCVPQACEQVSCLLACDNGFLVGEDGCEVCECAPVPCESDEECKLFQRCVAAEEPGAINCCPPGYDCIEDLPICPAECQEVKRCDPSQSMCQPDEACKEFERQDCCSENDDFCVDVLPSCPFVCQ